MPLLIIPPGGTPAKQSVKESVSLSDLATTVVEITGQQSESAFPGVSLSRFWKTPKPPA